MDAKIQALTQIGTWEFVHLPPSKETVGSNQVYKVKHGVDGSIECCKAKLVAKCFTQIEGIDFLETFSLVAKLSTVHLLLAIASTQSWTLNMLFFTEICMRRSIWTFPKGWYHLSLVKFIG